MRLLNKQEITSVLRNEEEEIRQDSNISEEDILDYLVIIEAEMLSCWTYSIYIRYWENYGSLQK